MGNRRHEDQWRRRECGEGGRQRRDKHVSPALATAPPAFAKAARGGRRGRTGPCAPSRVGFDATGTASEDGSPVPWPGHCVGASERRSVKASERESVERPALCPGIAHFRAGSGIIAVNAFKPPRTDLYDCRPPQMSLPIGWGGTIGRFLANRGFMGARRMENVLADRPSWLGGGRARGRGPAKTARTTGWDAAVNSQARRLRHFRVRYRPSGNTAAGSTRPRDR